MEGVKIKNMAPWILTTPFWGYFIMLEMGHTKVINVSRTIYKAKAGTCGRISVLTGDDREHLFLFQRISVAIKRFNAVLLHDGFPSEDHPD